MGFSKHSKNPKLLIFSVVFIDLLGFGIMIPMLPFYVRSFGESAIEVGHLMFVYSFMQFFLAPFWGRLSDRYGRRPILLLTIAGQAFSFFLAAIAPGFLILLLSRVLAGAFAANISTANAYMADITTKEERAKGMGIIGAAFGLGFVFGPAIGALLIPYGYWVPSAAAAALSAFNFFWAYKILVEPLTEKQKRQQNRRRLSWDGINQILGQKKFFIPVFLFFLLTLAFTQMEITFGLFSLDVLDLNERQAGLLLAFLGIVMAIVQGGLLRKLLDWFSEAALIQAGVLFIFGGLLVLASLEQLMGAFLALTLMAVGWGFCNPCLSAMMSKNASEQEQGTAMGIYQSGASLARIIGPITAGYLYVGDLRYPFWVAAIFVLLAGLVFRFRVRNKTDEALSH